MKQITRKSRSYIVRVPVQMEKSGGDNIRVYYARPWGKNDKKRWGREMAIHTPTATLILNGNGINAIKRVLKKAGEIE